MKKTTTFIILFYICLSLSGQILDSSKIDNSLTYTLINYYKNLYSNYSKYDLTNNKDFVDLTFYGTIQNYTGWLITIRIPAKTKEMILGDITNDNNADVVINVIKEGGETGGNATEFDLVIFLNKNGNLALDNVFQSQNICGCSLGYFIPNLIFDNQLIGVSYCYADNDPHCCPSLKYKTSFVYQDRKLVSKMWDKQ